MSNQPYIFLSRVTAHDVISFPMKPLFVLLMLVTRLSETTTERWSPIIRSVVAPDLQCARNGHQTQTPTPQILLWLLKWILILTKNQKDKKKKSTINIYTASISTFKDSLYHIIIIKDKPADQELLSSSCSFHSAAT